MFYHFLIVQIVQIAPYNVKLLLIMTYIYVGY